jgi:hypothetical protein
MTLLYITSVFFAGLAVRLASIGSGIGEGAPLDIVFIIGAIFFISLIAFIYFYSFKEKILAYDEDANQNSKKSMKSTGSRESQQSTECNKSKEDKPSIRPYPINGFDINLKYINGFSKPSWIWNLLVAKIICESISIVNGSRERSIYARIYYFYDGWLLPSRRFVSCKLSSHLRDTTILGSHILVLEFDEINKSYKIFRILNANDSI